MSLIEGLEHIIRENEPLAPYTSLKIGGVAEFFAEPTTQAELIEVIKRCYRAEIPMRLIGGGSNLLVRDEGVPGLVFHLSTPEFSQLHVEGNSVVVGGGVRLSHLVSTCAREGFAGAENWVGIPGTVGGGLHNNAGAGGIDLGTFVEEATCVTRLGEVVVRARDAMAFSYRSSSLNELAIIQATLRFERENSDSLTRQMQRNWIVRRARQPAIDEPTAYVFKDHGGDPAGAIIERAGLKGTQVGQVKLFERDANYFLARPGATSADFLRLMELVKRQVADRLGIELIPALQIW